MANPPDTGPLPEPADHSGLRQGLAETQDFLGMLQALMGLVHNRGQGDTPEAKRLAAITLGISAMFKEAKAQQAQGPEAAADPVRDLINAGDLAGAARLMATIVQDRNSTLTRCLARIRTLQEFKPIALRPGTNLAAIGPDRLEITGNEPLDYFSDFLQAHPAAARLVVAPHLQALIDAGDDGAKAHLAMLTAMAEYGDRLLPLMPDMRVRPPTGSPYQQVYDKMKDLLEHFEDDKTRVNLLNPGRLSALVQPDRDQCIKDIVASLQTHLTLKKDALRVATQLRDAFETYIRREFAVTPASQGLQQAIEELLQAEGIAFADNKANLLMNPHLDPARCIADLAALLGQDAPGSGKEACLAHATRIMERVNAIKQAVIKELAAQLYQELGGEPALFSVEVLSVGNMADAKGIPLQVGNRPGTPDYIGLFNNTYDGQVVCDQDQQPYFVSNTLDSDGVAVYRQVTTGELDADLPVALVIQPIKQDTDRHYQHPPTVVVGVFKGEAEVAQIPIQYHKQGNKLSEEIDLQSLPAGMSFDRARCVLNFGPGFGSGDRYTVTAQVKTTDTVGNWEDFAVVVCRTLAPHMSCPVVDVFEADKTALKGDGQILREPLIRVLARLMQKGAGLAFTELAAGGINPEPPDPQAHDYPNMRLVQVTVDYRIGKDAARGTIGIGIQSFTDPQPCPRYRHLSDVDPAGNIGLSQDWSVLAALDIVAALQQELAGDEEPLSKLQQLTSNLQMKLIGQPAKIGASAARMPS